MNKYKRYKQKHTFKSKCIICEKNFNCFIGYTGKYCSQNCQRGSLIGRKLSNKHKENIGNGVKNSKKYKEALKTRSHPVNSGQFGNGRTHLGKNHWNWQGGITSLNEKIRKSMVYKFWRKAVFERDNYTCVWCYKKSSKGITVILNADHIKPFSLFPKLRLKISNGRTLCKECHQKTNTYMGRTRWNQV